MRKSDPVRELAGPLYLLVLMLVFFPLIDVGPAVLPFLPGEMMWRYGLVGLLAGVLSIPVLGSILAVLVAAHLQQPRVLLTLAIVLGVAALLWLSVLPFFVLDGLHLRAAAAPEAGTALNVATAKVVLNLLFTIVVLGWVSLRALLMARRLRSAVGLSPVEVISSGRGPSRRVEEV